MTHLNRIWKSQLPTLVLKGDINFLSYKLITSYCLKVRAFNFNGNTYDAISRKGRIPLVNDSILYTEFLIGLGIE